MWLQWETIPEKPFSASSVEKKNHSGKKMGKVSHNCVSAIPVIPTCVRATVTTRDGKCDSGTTYSKGVRLNARVPPFPAVKGGNLDAFLT